MEIIKPYIDLLDNSKNIILTGAPGTGKTYLAKQIAKQMIGIENDEELEKSKHFDFVQFHPSYDYTDFVEGLRPTKPDENGNIGFEIKNGIFKAFCEKAIETKTEIKTDNFDESWLGLLNEVRKNISENKLTKIGNWEYSLSSVNSLKYVSETSPSKYSFTINKQNVLDTYQGKLARPSGAFKKDMEDVVDYMKDKHNLIDYKKTKINKSNSNNNYVFIIDEINRGEISKIFGELFFAIDPSYRGKKGAVKTQYSNLHENENEVFYIPENVFIIGTMNDIDRSVESFDFAMRRRFTWLEITAEQSAINMNLSAELKNKIQSLNNQISKTDGLNSSYHIGAAYFLNAEGIPREDYDKIWELRIEPLIKEYLRGIPENEDKIDKLKIAYNS
ncbi:McrB family protein [Psychroflexus sp. ALD_RP9]|uniref:McrB family protein n=1 Tax=Psychroflexus sp. ALD_RP9 TaxID=2777186 RepID=UPI001A8E16D2|nr:AAA family ATPase [Psychroflexus sp. ALD_RP9]QSS97809.1 AAA family ATPase [Psychroflexus sp. ALD_RP9]